eukprot:571119-Hanusia_phi.AAC.1
MSRASRRGSLSRVVSDCQLCAARASPPPGPRPRRRRPGRRGPGCPRRSISGMPIRLVRGAGPPGRSNHPGPPSPAAMPSVTQQLIYP